MFGCQAPDSGNAEILALFGTDEQKARYLQPLLDGEITSCYSMTEPQGGADPGLFITRAERDGDDWVINGEKWFSSNARHASFFIVMAVTNPEARTRDKMSMFIVPAGTPGIEIVRNVGVGTESHASHGYVRYNDVRVPADHVLGGEGQAFVIAQTRLGGGRIHHAMRTIALARKAFDMMCERAVSRQTRKGRCRIADDPGEDRRQLDRDRAVPAAGAAHRLADRQAPGLPAGAQRHRRGEGRHAARCCTTSRSGRCTCTARSASPTRCRSSP